MASAFMNIRESVTKIVRYGEPDKEGWVVRVWRQEEMTGPINREKLIADVWAILKTSESLWDALPVILKLQNVNAVEGLLQDGTGEVLYSKRS